MSGSRNEILTQEPDKISDYAPEELNVSDVEPGDELPLRSRFATHSTLFAEAFMRALLAWSFIVIFGLTVCWAFGNVSNETTWTNTKELLQLLLPAESALLGSAVGYYFGSRKP